VAAHEKNEGRLNVESPEDDRYNRFVLIKIRIYSMYILSGASFHIVVISFFVYIFVNLFENMIHYNIGRFSNKETKLELPTPQDFIKIALVMTVFALLQGLLTAYFKQYSKK